jgi:sRNA-binding protein
MNPDQPAEEAGPAGSSGLADPPSPAQPPAGADLLHDAIALPEGAEDALRVPMPAASAASAASAVAAVAAVAPDAATPAAPDAPAAPKPPDLSPADCARELAQRFPALFGTPRPQPLKLRIQADIQARAPGVFTRRALSHFLHRHTTGNGYLRALAAAPHRVDLDGQPAGEIAEEHRSAAAAELARRQALRPQRQAQAQPQQGQERQERQEPGARPVRPVRPVRPAQQARPGPSGRQAAPDRPNPPDRSSRPQRSPPAPRPGPQPPGDASHRPPQAHPRPEAPAAGAAPAAAPAAAASATAAPFDRERRERAALLRSFEDSTLTKANFCVLRRIGPDELDAALALAREERRAWLAAQPPRPQAPARPPQPKPQQQPPGVSQPSPGGGPRAGTRNGHDKRDGRDSRNRPAAAAAPGRGHAGPRS